ncbi:hypothetical protein LTR09_002271 [Extremus antarcticus]|uniref:Uncharacterized protein n=1 Tax=Extremus antarcticus TaxID=702011 RepID=A0AAJ0GGS2_9PEZI|nr:hypothetical protein LTR09_002271 [Extremus antarcticus]
MSDLTPIRIRGKRKAIAAEKWHHGKRRKATSTESSAPSEQNFGAQFDSGARNQLSRKQRKPRRRQLSRLEQLPTEVVQHIFELSENIELPSTSPILASQLSSPHLYLQTTVRLMGPILDAHDCKTHELTEVTRLMNSKFFTYAFFTDWLSKDIDRPNLLPPNQACLGYQNNDPDMRKQLLRTWQQLKPSKALQPPRKLLSAPFTADNLNLWELITSHITRGMSIEHWPHLVEQARTGLQQAVAEQSMKALDLFWHMGLKPDTELLRQAVVEIGCDRNVVFSITNRVMFLAQQFAFTADMDWLDPELWSWIDKAEARGDARGMWLKEILQFCGKPAFEVSVGIHAFVSYLRVRPEETFSEYAEGRWDSRDSWHASPRSD